MTRQQFCMIILYLQAMGGRNLEWQTRDGRTIQISGREGMRGYWERFLNTKPYPTRKALNEDEAFATFQDAAGEFILYDLWVDQGERLSVEKLLAKIRELFPEPFVCMFCGATLPEPANYDDQHQCESCGAFYGFELEGDAYEFALDAADSLGIPDGEPQSRVDRLEIRHRLFDMLTDEETGVEDKVTVFFARKKL